MIVQAIRLAQRSLDLEEAADMIDRPNLRRIGDQASLAVPDERVRVDAA